MEQITVRLPEELIEELDQIGEKSDRSRAEVIRDELNPGEDSAEVKRLRSELEQVERDRDWLKARLEAKENEYKTLVEQRQENDQLLQHVEEERTYRQAGLFTRAKWWVTGVPDDVE